MDGRCIILKFGGDSRVEMSLDAAAAAFVVMASATVVIAIN